MRSRNTHRVLNAVLVLAVDVPVLAKVAPGAEAQAWWGTFVVQAVLVLVLSAIYASGTRVLRGSWLGAGVEWPSLWPPFLTCLVIAIGLVALGSSPCVIGPGAIMGSGPVVLIPFVGFGFPAGPRRLARLGASMALVAVGVAPVAIWLASW